MFRYICFAVMLASAWAAPVDEQVMVTEPVMELRAPPVDTVGPVVDPEMDMRVPVVGIMDAGLQQSTDGAYNFHYRGEDGSFRQESAVVVNPGTEYQYLKISGSYSYFDANGKEVVVHYKADDRGFVPEGNNIMPQISTAAKINSQLPRVEEKPRPQDVLSHVPHVPHVPHVQQVPVVGSVWNGQIMQV
ncbi:endocuticle structural glycoprotein SgAbd-2 [Zeugodacus cucurbitae]|nr:endocuticle structural glycoprotein SgAbd-2 [Zeugodacus cucurbitae]